MQEFLLLVGVKVLEHVRGKGLRDHAEDHDLVLVRQVGDHVGQVSRHPLGEQGAQTSEITGGHEALDLGLEEFAEHGIKKAVGW